MRKNWLTWTHLTDPTPEKVCKRGLTTPRGTFIFVTNEKVYKPEAIIRCNQMGAILAPVTEREDFEKLIEFGNKCRYYRMPRQYWVGFEALSNDTRLFSNGEVWNWDKHSNIYSHYYNHRKDCVCHMLNLQKTDRMYVAGSHYGLCHQITEYFICLKPAIPKSSKCEALEQHSSWHSKQLAYSMLSNGFLLILVCILVALLIGKKQLK